MKNEEYLADVQLVAQRVLTELEFQLFRFHYLLGADWKACSKRLNLDRGSFFHGIYRVEEKLGRAFAETAPYPLFPLADYFAGIVRRRPARDSTEPIFKKWSFRLRLTA
ncbi:MAG TPA: hypothetical protein VMU19_15260 [Bryobacteraceae bacterium]|nr:hypothetical protein [Bryobacteraceae bacterium]